MVLSSVRLITPALCRATGAAVNNSLFTVSKPESGDLDRAQAESVPLESSSETDMKKLGMTLATLLLLGSCRESRGEAERVAPPEATREYHDPDRRFTLQLPAGWTVERKVDANGWLTFAQSENPVAKLIILANPIPSLEGEPADLRDRQLVELARPIFTGWIESLKDQGRVEILRRAYRVKVRGMDAMRLDVRYFRGDARDPRQAQALFLFSRRSSFFLVASAERAGRAVGDQVLASWQVLPGE